MPSPAAVLALVAATTLGGRGAATKPHLAPPPFLNIVHHRLKPGAPPTYQSLEASIVAAFERAKVPLYWITFQSTKDARDILYLNVFNTPDGLARAADTYRSLAPAHPELARLSTRLAALIDDRRSMLTTRRDEVAYTRTDVDFATMRALMLVTFAVRPGHEGKFMEGVRKASGSGAHWTMYEANDDSTFVLLAPLRSRAEAKRRALIPRALRALRGVYRRAEIELYTLSGSMSRPPNEFVAAGSKSAAPRPRAH
jgi:hypothetical protein